MPVYPNGPGGYGTGMDDIISETSTINISDIDISDIDISDILGIATSMNFPAGGGVMETN